MTIISDLGTQLRAASKVFESRSKKEVVIDDFDGFFGIQLILRPMALSRTAEIEVWPSTIAQKNI